ncbi:unnamed protein product [Colias eurytheme]|nr:unnamed protein product [Colias eurytheme]
MLRLFALSLCILTAHARRSANADLLEDLLRTTDLAERYSNNIIEDAFLDANGLAKKYGYPFEEHPVVTEDGYILGLHRIPHGRDQNNVPGPRPAVLVMHGLFSSSADFIIMGPGTAMAYILAEAGYDVWLGNARGTYYSRKHVSINPNDKRGIYWDFSWDEIGNRDLPAMIDYILHATGNPGVHYIGISQGTTTFFTMGSLRPEYNSKIISMHAMAPVAYLAHNKQKLFHVLAKHGNTLETIMGLLGLKELLPNNVLMTILGFAFCSDDSPFQPLCSALIFAIAGYNPAQHNATMLPAKIGHVPAGASLRQLVHYGQGITDKDFRRYDHGALRNLLEYGTLAPPKYRLSQVTAPVYLHYSVNDPLAEIEDVQRLHRELGGPAKMLQVPDPTFTHLDFMWGIDAKTLVFDRVIEIMRLYDNDLQK